MRRTADTFRQHLENRVGVCGTFYLIMHHDSVLGPEYLIVPNSCSSNYCTTCRQRNLIRLRHALIRAMAYHRWRLVTLTFAHRNITRQAQLSALKISFDRLSKRLRRRFPSVAYVRTIEVHADGYPHVHMVIDKYIPVAWLQLHWKEVGGGMVDIREGKKQRPRDPNPHSEHTAKPTRFSHHDAAGYLTEEIEKTAQDPHSLGVDFWCARIRAISTSRTLKLKDDQSEWKYYGKAATWDDIELLYANATVSAMINDRPQPTIATKNRVAFLGAGYT